MGKAKCCFVYFGSNEWMKGYRFRCRRRAEFYIFGGSNQPEDDTEACERHVGALLGTPSWLAKDNTQWTVVLLAAAEGGET